MKPPRPITSSQARARFGELLDSLATAGAVQITRNGRIVAVISSPTAAAGANMDPRLPDFAKRYSTGELTWRQVEDETGATFGELLVELGRQGLQLPRATAEKSEAQRALLQDVLAQNAPVKPPSS